MKKILLILCLLTAGNITKSWAQEPVVIKQDGATGDLDAEENEEPDVRDLSFRERLKFGGGIGGLQFQPFGIAVSPMAGYLLTNDITVGLAFDYRYVAKYTNVYGSSPSQSFYIPRIFAQYRIRALETILPKAFAQAELQQYYGKVGSFSSDSPVQGLTGLGLGYGGMQFTVLYNWSYNADPIGSPYTSPWVIRVGGFFF